MPLPSFGFKPSSTPLPRYASFPTWKTWIIEDVMNYIPVFQVLINRQHYSTASRRQLAADSQSLRPVPGLRARHCSTTESGSSSLLSGCGTGGWKCRSADSTSRRRPNQWPGCCHRFHSTNPFHDRFLQSQIDFPPRVKPWQNGPALDHHTPGVVETSIGANWPHSPQPFCIISYQPRTIYHKLRTDIAGFLTCLLIDNFLP